MQMSLAKKIFAVSSAAAMVLAAVPFVASAAVHSAGTNVVSNGTVYFVNSSGQKQPYTSAGAFLSYGFNSWSNVMPASAEDLALPTGAFVPAMDGSLINDHGTVYLITNGQKAGFTSASNFLGLGYSWSNVIPGDVSFMSSAALVNSTAMSHPAGSLVNDHGTVYLMSSTGKMGIPSLSVFNSWGYSFSKVVPANSYDSAVAMSNGVMMAMVPGQLSPLSPSTTTPPPPSTSGVNVSVASSTPAAGSVAKAAKSVMTRFNLMAGSQSASITSLTATRIGLSSDSDVSNVYLWNEGTNTQLAVGTINTGRVTFSLATSPLTVAAGSTVTLSVRADINTTANATTGDSIGYGIAQASDIVGATATGSFPVNGNLMTIAAVSNLGALTINSPATLATTMNSGQTQQNVGYFTFAGSNQPLSVSYIKFTNVGSVATSNLANFNLFNGSTQVGTTQQLNSDNTVVYNLSSSPLLIPSGQTVILWLKADITGGPNRNFQFTIQRTSDVTATDTTYNAGIVPGLGTATGTSPVPTSTNNQVTINAGSATLSVDSSSPTGNTATGASGITYGTFAFTAAGEDLLVSSLTVTMTNTSIVGGSASDYFTNGKLVDVTTSGSPAQIGSTANLNVNTAANGGVTTVFNIPGNWRVPAGTTRKLSVVADSKANTATAGQLAVNGNIITAGITSVTAQGATSLSSVTLGSATARNLNFVQGNLTAAKNPALIDAVAATPTGVVGQTQARVASFTLTAGAAEGVNVTQLQIRTNTAGDATRFQNLFVKVAGTQVGTTQGVLADTTNYTFTPSTQLIIPAGSTVTVDVYADILSSAATGAQAAAFALQSVTSTGVVDNASITSPGATAGQQDWIVSGGTLTFSLDPATPTTAQLQQEVMGTLQQTLAVFNLAANAVEPINVTTLIVTDTSSSSGDLQNLKLYVNGAQVGPTVSALSAASNGTATFNFGSTPLVVPVNSNISVYVKADITAFPNETSGGTHTLNIAAAASVTAAGAVSGAAPTVSGLGSALNANQAVVYRTALTIAKDASSPSGVTASSTTQTVAIMNVSNATNSANQQATWLPTLTTLGNATTAMRFTFSSTIVPSATARTFKVFKASDLTTPILACTITPTGATSSNWSGTLDFGNGIGGAAPGVAGGLWTPTGPAWTAPTYNCTGVTYTPQTLNSGQTVQYVAQFDTSDSASQKTFTLSIPTQAGTNKVWYDGSSSASTIMGGPVTFGTVSY